jgi:amphiphysin
MTNGKTGLFPSNFTEPVKAKAKKLSTFEEMTALFDYDAQEDNELSLKKGDIVTIVERFEDNEDWVIGQSKGKTGMVPASYLQKMTAQKVKAFCTYL